MGIKQADITLQKAVAKEDGVLEFVASTNVVDRQGDIVEQNWELKSFRKNPVFLYHHNSFDLPIGKVVRIWTQATAEKAGKRAKKETRIQVQFVPDEIYPFAGVVRRMYEAGYMKAVSVGFRALELDQLDSKGREDLGLGRYGERITRSELLEVSSVGIGANQDALMTSVSKGLLAQEAVDQIRGMDPAKGVDQAAVMKALDAIESRIETRGFEEPEMVEDRTDGEPSDLAEGPPPSEGIAELTESVKSLVEIVRALVAVRKTDAEEPVTEPAVGDAGSKGNEPSSESGGKDSGGGGEAWEDEVDQDVLADLERATAALAGDTGGSTDG